MFLEEKGIVGSVDAGETLYVSRPLLACQSFRKWAKAQGFLSVVADPHVTLLLSKKLVDWNTVERDTSVIVQHDGTPRSIASLGSNGAVVLRFVSSDLAARHDALVAAGGSHDYPTYEPHVTITYQAPDGLDLSRVVAYQGSLIFGPEKFQTVRDGGSEFVKPDEIMLSAADCEKQLRSVLLRAADLLEQEGWCQGSYVKGDARAYLEARNRSTPQASRCMIGAIAAILGIPSPDIRNEMSCVHTPLFRVLAILREFIYSRKNHPRHEIFSYLGTDPCLYTIASWNDAKQRTIDEVINCLRECALGG